MTDKERTHFGFEEVPKEEKVHRVRGVFDSVAKKYDLMNDLLSLRLHRIWKRIAVLYARPGLGNQVLDLAGGTGDLARLLAEKIGKTGQVTIGDINQEMLINGRDKLIESGVFNRLAWCQLDAEALPFQDNQFDIVMIGFGLRNVTEKEKALAEMTRVTKPGGRVVVLEFSEVQSPLFAKLYDWYSFKVLPKIGAFVAKDADSYQYLAESIRRHPNQETLKNMMSDAGLMDCAYENILQGVVAIHRGFKPL